MTSLRGSLITVTPTITGGGYTAGDAVGGLLTFKDAYPTDDGDGDGVSILESVTISDKANQNTVELDLVLFSETFTATSDNGAFDPSDADLLKVRGVVKLTTDDVSAFTDNSVYSKTGIGMVLQNTGTDGSLYGQLVCRTAAPTYQATSDIQITIGILRG